MDLGELFAGNAQLGLQAHRLRLDSDRPFPLLMAKVKLTWRCNLRCGICTTWRRGEEQAGRGDPLTAEKVLSLLERLRDQGLKKVHFSGGEPLLRPDLGEILAGASDLDLQVNLTTNGTLLDKEKARLIVETRVHTAAVSVDGATEKRHDQMRGVPGAWKRTFKGLARLRERKDKKGRGPVIAVNTVVTRKNIESLPLLFERLEEAGVESWRLLPVRTPDKKMRPLPEQLAQMAGQKDRWASILDRDLTGWRSERAAREAAKGRYAVGAYKDIFCWAPWFHLFVDADGAVYSCCTGRWRMPEYGNVLKDELSDILWSRPRREVCAGMATGHVYEVCPTCDEFLEENEIFARAAEKEVTE